MKMDDIARIANVSKSAVSIAFSGKPGISTETREKILSVANQHGYTPRQRNTNVNSTKTLTFLAFTNTGIVLKQYDQQPFFKELIHHIEVRCRQKGYTLIFSTIDVQQLADNIKHFAAENRSDGILLLGTNLNKEQIKFVTETIQEPVVILDNCYESLPARFVSINNVMGAYQAVEHLIGQGHQQIAYLQSDVRIHNFEERKSGFLHALHEHQLPFDDNHLFTASPAILAAQDPLREQLNTYHKTHKQLPSAIFCECDYLAISLIKTCSEMGYHIPHHLSIVGFDNILESVVITPELTTIQVEKELMANIAVDLLFDNHYSIDNRSIKVLVDTELVERKSTKNKN